MRILRRVMYRMGRPGSQSSVTAPSPDVHPPQLLQVWVPAGTAIPSKAAAIDEHSAEPLP